jgi:hypothetical protein
VGKDVLHDDTLVLSGTAQAVLEGMPLQPLAEHGRDAVGARRRRLEGRQALLDSADHRAGKLARLGN